VLLWFFFFFAAIIYYFFVYIFFIELTTHVLRRQSCARSLFSAFGAKATIRISALCIVFAFSPLCPCCCLFIFIHIGWDPYFFPIFYCLACCCNAERARSSKNDKSTIMGVMGCHEWSDLPNTRRVAYAYQRYRYEIGRYLLNVHVPQLPLEVPKFIATLGAMNC